MTHIELQHWHHFPQFLSDVKSLYFASFPPQERRLWTDIERLLSQPSSPYNLLVIVSGEMFTGFITWWSLNGFCYIEHFAVAQSMRGCGVGAKALKQFVASTPLPIVLEVELPDSDEIARRRIDFYQRNGFVAHLDFPYIQPPYSPSLPSVPLMLMTANTTTQLNLHHIAATLHQSVYLHQ